MRQMAFSAFAFSVMSVSVKLVSRDLPTSHTVLARGVITLLISFIALLRKPVWSWGKDKPRLLLRGVAGFVSLNCFYFSLRHLPLADATVIQYASPVFTALLAAVVLRERVGLASAVFIGTSFVGMVLVAQPSFLFSTAAAASPRVLAISLLGAVVSSISYVTIHRLRSTDDPDLIVFYFPLVAVPLSVPPVLADATMPTFIDVLLLLAVGVSTQVAQLYQTKALHNEPAGRAAAVSYLQVGFAYVWGMLVFRRETERARLRRGGDRRGVDPRPRAHASAREAGSRSREATDSPSLGGLSRSRRDPDRSRDSTLRCARRPQCFPRR